MKDTREHILIVEDELHTRNSLSLILQGGGYRVSLASNGSEALKKLSEAEKNGVPVELVLTDILMPEMQGDRFLETLRYKGVFIPVIAMTGYGNTDMVDRLMRAGCKGYLEKPFDDEKLFIRIRNVLDETNCDGENETHLDNSSRLSQELKTYKRHLSRLREQLDSAADVYQDLVKLHLAGNGIEVSLRNRPFAKLGGDFVDMANNSDIYDIFLADVSGHDLGSSFHTILLKAFFEENCRKRNDGRTLFHLLNRHLLETGKNDRMITALFVRIDLDRMTGEAVSAAHPPLIHVKHRSRETLPLSIEGDALGIYQKAEFDAFKFDLVPGDRLYLYTDGVTGVSRLNVETTGYEKLTVSGLSDLIRKFGNGRLEETVGRIWENVLEFSNHKPGDDMLLFATEIPPNLKESAGGRF